MSYDEITYWVAINELLKMKLSEKNSLVIDIIHNNKMRFEEFFNLSSKEKVDIFKLSNDIIEALDNIKSQVPSIAFQVEDLYKQGMEILTLNDKAYPERFKKIFKRNCPMIIYLKGNRDLLNDNVAAVVGSRDVSSKGIQFTQNIVRRCIENNYVIASGYARGVDRIAHDCAVQNDGKTIAVIPQGILKFKSDLKKLYPYIMEGRVLVISTFSPNDVWTVGRAMERNKYIYGLAERIYVSETQSSGGTWSGATEGLKKNQDVFVRYADMDEKCANNQLVQLGAKPVDIDGDEIKNYTNPNVNSDNVEQKINNILEILANRKMSAEEIEKQFDLHITPYEIIQKLVNVPNVNAKIENSRLLFYISKQNEAEQLKIF